MTSTKQHEALLHNRWSPPEVALVAEVPESTVRNWKARGFVTARSFLKLDGEDLQPDRRRAAALKLKAETVAAGEDARWIDEALSRLDQQKGPVEFTVAELLQVCALAELSRVGIAPAQAADSYLVDKLTRDLFDRACGRPAAGERPTLDPGEPRYLVAERRTSAPALSIQCGLVPDELVAYFKDVEERRSSASWVVVDTAKLLRRILMALVRLRGPRP